MAEQTTAFTGKPLQRISWTEKVKDGFQWFKQNAEYYMSLSNFHGNNINSRKDLGQLYQVYNGDFPAKWFEHVTNPLNAKNQKHTKYPGKIRPISILRTNIDLLLNEYPRRPFVYHATNMGEGGYNRFTEALSQKIEHNLTQHFVAAVQQEALAQGVPVEEIPGLEEVELPEAVKEKFGTSYKDSVAIHGQKWMKRALKEYKIREELLKCFKDWLISGYAFSYKGISHGSLFYERISPLDIDYEKSEDQTNVEDGEWVVARRFWTMSDIVDEFYDELKEKDYLNLETRTHFARPEAFFAHLNNKYNKGGSHSKIPVYHIVWKGKKAKKLLTYPDPMTGQPQQMEVDEDYPVNKDIGESAETIYGNETYETWRIGDDIYVRMGAVQVQRNEMNNTSACKLPYNGRAFSDTHAENISVLEMGLPLQILYMITGRTLEMTIAKSKGKILLIDKNAIPRGDGWDDEKFFYYGEAMGWGLLNRHQQGVDKTWNQYQVLDMGLFDHIKHLIELQEHFKQQWDDLIGINRPRKGATYASDGKGVSEMGLHQSSVITDGIFTLFEQFTESELQGLLDLSRFTEAEGVRRIYNQDDFTDMLFSVDPHTYCNSELGILMNSSVEEQNTLRSMQQQVAQMIQNNVKPSTILTIAKAMNVAELDQQLKKIEEMEAAMEQQMGLSEQEAQAAADERAQRFEGFRHSLELDTIDKEWDRKDQNTMLKGEYDVYSAANLKGDGDADNDGIPDVNEIEKRVIDRQKILTTAQVQLEQQRSKERMHKEDIAMRNKELTSNERLAKEKNKTDLRKARYSKNKKSK
jgi:hypothetical protein